MTARYKFFPEVKTKGMTAAPRLVLFTSEHVSLILTSEQNINLHNRTGLQSQKQYCITKTKSYCYLLSLLD